MCVDNWCDDRFAENRFNFLTNFHTNPVYCCVCSVLLKHFNCEKCACYLNTVATEKIGIGFVGIVYSFM